jgi:molybdate transport system substrate-binding protein
LTRAALIACAALALAATRANAAQHASPITVYAASSLTDVFPKIDSTERYSFGGSNTLAANTALPNQLYAKGLCSKPVVFTRNALVIVVPRSNPAGIKSVFSLTRPGIKLDIAASGVPVGSYTLQVLKNMNLSAAVLQNVVSQETDVREVLSKVALGEADAGFVYSTDAKTVPGQVTVIKLPAWAQPKVQYGICIVDASSDKTDARSFVTKVLSKSGQRKLLAAGFLPRVKRS